MKMIALCIHKYFSLNVFFIVSYLYFSCYMKKYLDMISFSSRLNDSIFVIKYCKSYATICNNCLIYRIHAKTKQFVFSPVSQLTPMYPGVHSQTYLLTWSIQLPCTQGELSHSFISLDRKSIINNDAYRDKIIKIYLTKLSTGVHNICHFFIFM